MDITDLHRRTVEGFVATLAAVGDRWDAPTPCPQWNVRSLVNHVVGEDLWTVPMMGGATIADIGDRFDGDVLGDDPLATGRGAAEAAIIATASGVVAGQMVHLSFGDTPAEEYAYQLAADHLVHGWDLAMAVRSDPQLDDDLVEALADWFAEREELYRSSGAIADRPTSATSTCPADDLLLAFGRHPAWSASSA
ncbi:MAG TPA: TIGR03086 family metal-binding protein [Acidimicrobiales bacterium]|jgi:uncharacterized protein (TIGR03086 family)|nr:TIGR03086 family metal-binding protein [Acidimicrobiales bacterium]